MGNNDHPDDKPKRADPTVIILQIQHAKKGYDKLARHNSMAMIYHSTRQVTRFKVGSASEGSQGNQVVHVSIHQPIDAFDPKSVPEARTQS